MHAIDPIENLHVNYKNSRLLIVLAFGAGFIILFEASEHLFRVFRSICRSVFGWDVLLAGLKINRRVGAFSSHRNYLRAVLLTSQSHWN
jgi:hypothetical protein